MTRRCFRTLIISAALALTGCAAVPADYNLAPESGEALILIETEPAQVLREGGEFKLDVSRYVPETGMLSYSFSGGFTSTNEVENQPGQPQFVVARTKVTGEHVIAAVTHKHNWIACLNGGTHQFNVGPGEVVFVGRVDPGPALTELGLSTPRSSSSGRRYFVLDTPRLPLTPPSQLPGWEERARAYLQRNFPNVRGPLRAAESRPATFSTGRSLLGEKICYGYGRKPQGGASGAAPR